MGHINKIFFKIWPIKTWLGDNECQVIINDIINSLGDNESMGYFFVTSWAGKSWFPSKGNFPRTLTLFVSWCFLVCSSSSAYDIKVIN